MIVEVIGGADEHPEARVVDVDDLGRLHLALGEVTDEEAAEVLERAGLGRFQDADTAFLDVAAPAGRRRAPRHRRRTGPAVGRDDRQGPQPGLAVRRRRQPAGARGERRRGLIPAQRNVHPALRNFGTAQGSYVRVIVVTPPDTPGCRGAYDLASRNPVMTGTPGRPLSAELSEQLISVAVDILAEEGWGRLNSDRIAARARAGKAGIYRRWPTMAALARTAVEPVQPRHPAARTPARCGPTSSALVERWTRPLDREERAVASIVGAARHEEELRAGLDDGPRAAARGGGRRDRCPGRGPR